MPADMPPVDMQDRSETTDRAEPGLMPLCQPRFEPKATLRGIPVSAIMAALPYLDQTACAWAIGTKIGLNFRDTIRFVEYLNADGFLSYVEDRDQAPVYKLGPLGSKLKANKINFRQPRARGARAIEKAVAAARLINKSPDRYPVVVTAIRVFGSFAQGAEIIGDVDVCVDVANRFEDMDAQILYEREIQERIVQREAFGRWIHNPFWPELFTLKTVKRADRFLSLMGSDQANGPILTVYSFDPGTGHECLDHKPGFIEQMLPPLGHVLGPVISDGRMNAMPVPKTVSRFSQDACLAWRELSERHRALLISCGYLDYKGAGPDRYSLMILAEYWLRDRFDFLLARAHLVPARATAGDARFIASILQYLDQSASYRLQPGAVS
jgi:predicted nucleotidyltransferase